MIALSCGVHEARRRIPCPICPRVLAELRETPVGVHQAFSPIGQGKARRKSAATKGECVRLAKEGRTSREIADALGISLATAQTYAAGHLAPRGSARRIDHDEVIRRAKAGQYAAEIAKALGISDTTAQRLGRGHFVPRAVPRGRPDASYTRKASEARTQLRNAVDGRIRCGWSTSTICRRLGVHRSFVGLRRKALAARAREAA